MGPAAARSIAFLRRRLVQRLVAGCILGLATAWTVAFGIQVFSTPVLSVMAEPSLAGWLFGRPAFASAAEEYWVGFGSYLRSRGPNGGPPAVPWHLRPIHPAHARGTIIQAYGWPVRVLAGGRTFSEAETLRDWGVISVAGPEGYAFPFESAVVYRPLWLGSAIGGVCYAVVWWLPLGVPTALLRIRAAKRRARRGRCPECGYDLAGQKEAGCPECGWARRASRSVGRGEPMSSD